MTGGGDSSDPLRRDLVPGGIDALPSGLSADLAILDLDYGRRRGRGAQGHAGHLELAGRAIKKMHGLTGADGICCVISRDARDAETGALAMLGTKVVDDIGPWVTSDEIIWSTERPGPWQDLPGGGGRASELGSDFYQIWVLAKNNPAPYRSETLGRAAMQEGERQEAVASVWHVPADATGGHDDPVPHTVLSRLVMSYSEPGDLVLDPYANGGVTAVVCESLGRGYVCSFDGEEKLSAARERIRQLRAGRAATVTGKRNT